MVCSSMPPLIRALVKLANSNVSQSHQYLASSHVCYTILAGFENEAVVFSLRNVDMAGVIVNVCILYCR